jgi:hypothetical protein
VTVWLFAAAGLAAARSRGRETATPYVPRLVLAIQLAALAAIPSLLALSQGDLDRAVAAFADGDCATVTRAAGESLDTLGVRARPHELLGYCAIRSGRHDAAAGHMRTAIGVDPRSGDLHYGLALAQAAAGRDPRPAIRRARALSPRDALIIDAQRLFDTPDRGTWRRWGRRLAARLTVL